MSSLEIWVWMVFVSNLGIEHGNLSAGIGSFSHDVYPFYRFS